MPDTHSAAGAQDANLAPPPHSTRARRVVFPWVWVALLVVARLGVEAFDVVDDLRVIGNFVAVALGLVGVAGWYAVRGRGPLWSRLAPLAVVLAFPFALRTAFELRHDGTGRVVGLTLRGRPERDALLATPEASIAAEGEWTVAADDYPRFLGVGPWAEAPDARIDPAWRTNPPEELWRVEVGAGWSAFAIAGDYCVTQEQRGDKELVVCREAESGEVAWSHEDDVRYDPTTLQGEMGGPGPRATPTIHQGRVYTHGATGIVNCLDATTGELVWTCDTVERFGADNPTWGASGSPLVIEDLGVVVVNVGAPWTTTEDGGYDSSLVAFELATGGVRWASGWRQTSYASPSLVTLSGERTLLQVNQDALTAHDPETGRVLWEHPWPGASNANANCSQAIAIAPDTLLLTKGYGTGASLIRVRVEGERQRTEPLWTPPIKPVLETKFSNVVVREGFAYGLDGTVLAAVELATGKTAWKKRRRPAFGYGQVMLAGEHLLVLTEGGEVVLVDASPDSYRERAALQALDPDEICWNNPALAGDRLFVRNAVEAVAYRLPTVGAPPAGATGR